MEEEVGVEEEVYRGGGRGTGGQGGRGGGAALFIGRVNQPHLISMVNQPPTLSLMKQVLGDSEAQISELRNVYAGFFC